MAFYSKENVVAEWNTGSVSLEQLASIEWAIDNIEFLMMKGLRQGNLEKIDEFYDMLNIYFSRLNSLMWTSTQVDVGIDIKEINDLYFRWKREAPRLIPNILVRKMVALKIKLYELKQKKMNLGIPMKKELTARERLHKAIQ